MRKIEFSAGAVFWFALVIAFFGFAFLNAVHAADLPGSSFALAPVSKVSLIQDKELVLTYAPEKLDSKLTEKTFSDISGLVEIEKTAYIGDAEFKISICRDVSELKQFCSEYAKDKFTCLKTRDAFVIVEKCEETAPSKELTIKSGERIKIEPTKIIYASTPAHPLGEYRVWENLFIGGEKIEGATWWEGIAMSLRDSIAPSGSSNRNTDGVKLSQSFHMIGTASVCVINYYEATTGASPPPTTLTITIVNSTGTIATTNNSINFLQNGREMNASFTTCPTLLDGVHYDIDFIAAGTGILGLLSSASDGRVDACLWRDGENSCAWGDDTSANIKLWGFDANTVAPILDACNPANGSSVSIGVTQFRINATDDDGLSVLNHTDTFTGTTAYNFTPFNGSAWFVDVNFTTNGTYYWWAAANDTSGNSNQTANCSLIVVAPTTTTTTAATNETVTNVTVSLPGFGWGVLFFIILVSFIVLGGLSKS